MDRNGPGREGALEQLLSGGGATGGEREQTGISATNDLEITTFGGRGAMPHPPGTAPAVVTGFSNPGLARSPAELCSLLRYDR